MSRDDFRSDEGTVARCEMDTHADTCVAGPNFTVLEFTGEQCDVTPYTNDYQPITNVSVVNAATAYTDELTGETVVLRFNQVLWYGKKMKMSLINPNQLRHFGITVSDDPTDTTRLFGISSDDVQIPFEMDGTTIYFNTRAPSTWEMENCKVIHVTDDTVWNPASVTIAQVHTLTDIPIIETTTMRNLCALNRKVDTVSTDADGDMSTFDPTMFMHRMIGAVRLATSYRDNPGTIAFVGTNDRHSQVNAETVARKFRCGIETAQRTLKTTTQRGVRHTIHPLHRRYRVDHLNLHRRRLDDTFYMDTLFLKVKSLNGHTCAQLITNGTFTRVYPMESKASRNIAQALTEIC